MSALIGSKITANGTYTISTHPGHRYTVMAGGTFGSGTVTMSFLDSGSGLVVDIPTYGVFDAATAFEIAAASDKLQIVLAGATSPSLTLLVNHIPA